MVHKTVKRKRIDDIYIIVRRTSFSAHRQHVPKFELIKLEDGDLRKAKAIAKKKSGVVSDVAFVLDSTGYLYKGGERRI